MNILIYIAVPIENEQTLCAELKRCCAETGDQLIGHRVYEDVGEVLFVVCLAHQYVLTKHIHILNQALQAQLILSFQPEKAQVMMICSQGNVLAPHNIAALLKGFPLRPSESWFPAIDDSEKAYLCTNTRKLNQQQIAWLESRHLTYLPT